MTREPPIFGRLAPRERRLRALQEAEEVQLPEPEDFSDGRPSSLVEGQPRGLGVRRTEIQTAATQDALQLVYDRLMELDYPDAADVVEKMKEDLA